MHQRQKEELQNELDDDLASTEVRLTAAVKRLNLAIDLLLRAEHSKKMRLVSFSTTFAYKYC